MTYTYPAGTLRYVVTSVGTEAFTFQIIISWTGRTYTLANSDVVDGSWGILDSNAPAGPVSVIVMVTNAQGDTTTLFDTDAKACLVENVTNGRRYSWNLGDASTEEETNSVDADGNPIYNAGFDDLIIQVHVPEPVQGGAGARIGARVSIYQIGDDGLEFVCNVPRFRNLKWSHEMNAPGAAQLELNLNDVLFYKYPELQNYFNVVQVSVNGKPVKTWVIEDISPIQVGQNGPADRWVTFSGRGVLAALENAVVYPEYGLRELVSTERFFNFSSNQGVWYTAADWKTPTGIRWDKHPTKNNVPKGWPDKAANWLWANDPRWAPSNYSPPGSCWFRTEFDLDVTTPVIIYMTADDYYQSYLDGQMIFNQPAIGAQGVWNKFAKFPVILSAGHHVLATKATNLANNTNGVTPKGYNRAGYIFSIFRLDDAWRPTSDNILRSTKTNTVVKSYGAQPGWSGAGILMQLIEEAQDRGVNSLYPFQFDFTNLQDSDGNLWNDVQERKVEVGTTDLYDLTTQVIEIGLDLAAELNPADPSSFLMRAWKQRGTDLSDIVQLLPGRDVTAHSPSSHGTRVRNQALMKFSGGWIELFAAHSKDAYGRREVGLSVGSSTTTRQTRYAGQAALRESIEPETTVPVSITSRVGPQPYTDFDVGDTITVPGLWSETTPARLMSISAQLVGENTFIQYDLDFYPITDNQDITSAVTATGGSFQSIGGRYAHEVLTDSPWGFWRLNDTGEKNVLADASGHKYSMSVVYKTASKPVYKQPGPVDLSLQFNSDHSGTKDGEFDQAHAKTTVTSSKMFYYRACTLEIWLKRASSTTNAMSMLTLYSGGSTIVYDLGISPAGHPYFRYRQKNGSLVTLVATTVVVPTSKFMHVVGSYGSKGVKLYVDGVRLLYDSTTPAVDLLRCQAYVRADLDSQANNVTVADPAVYFQQLLDARIKTHFTAAEYTA